MKLDHVIVPLIKSEITCLRTWLRYVPRSGMENGRIYFSIDQRWSARGKQQVAESFSRSALCSEGWKFEFVECEMSEDESFYIKDSHAEVDLEKYPYGQKSGPNMQFFRNLRKLRALAPNLESVLLLEVDAFPLVPGWLQSLNQRVQSLPSDVLIAGARYLGQSKLSDAIKTHLNGNAIYFLGQPDFDRFLINWESLLLDGVKITKFLAYDIAIPWFTGYRETNGRVRRLQSEETEYLARCYEARVRDLSDYLINYGGAAENDVSYTLNVDQFKRMHPNALIAHGKCFQESIYRLRSLLQNDRRATSINAVCDLIQEGAYEDAIMSGVSRIEIVQLLTRKVERLGEVQKKLMQSEQRTHV